MTKLRPYIFHVSSPKTKIQPLLNKWQNASGKANITKETTMFSTDITYQ